MYKALSPGAIGVKAGNLTDAIAAARVGGFGGVEFSAHEVADLVDKGGAESVKALFAAAGLQPAGWGLPTDWRGGQDKWREGLAELPRLAHAAHAIGCPRTSTWIMPASDDLTFAENKRFHVERFTPIARILADNGCSIGLEFIGPKTLRDNRQYPFIYTLGEMLAMGAEIGPNVGLLLDCWHWHTSHGTLEELHALRPEQVVYVHVNDAPSGIPTDEQLDNVRELPGATGVIDIAGFLQAVQSIGYTGPVTPEPFNQALNDLPSDATRLQKVGAAMDDIFRTAGIGK